jgi:putative ABC transport system substrate-binding protein
MRRREFITLTGGAAVGWPLAARAQAPRPIRIGTLHVYSPPDPWLEALRQGLLDFGYAESRNIKFEERWAEGRNDRLDGLAQDLIDSKVDILVVMMGPALAAARRKTSTVPIVMAVSSDGVGAAGVASLARPGGNVTGVTLMSPDLVGLRLALLREAAPTAKRIAVLYSAAEPPTEKELRETEAAAQTLGVTLQPVEASKADALNQAFASAIAGGADALLTFPHVFAFFHRRRIAELAAQHRLPAMYGWREYAAAGGLMAYGPNVAATIRRAASFVDRIIKGANPAEMPIEQPTKFELVINAQAARALGLEVPPTLLARADEVIE